MTRTPVLARLPALTMICLSLCLPFGNAPAAGFYFESVGTPLSVATAGAANATNNLGPDSAWANPAGLTGISEPVILAGLTLVAPTAKWDADVSEAGGISGGNSGQPAVVPSVFYAQPLADRWHFGFGMSALTGGGADYGNGFVGRYGATKVQLQGLGATWSFGFRATDRLALGFGASVIQTQFEQKIAINQSALLGPGTPDGEIYFKELDDFGVQPIVGLQFQVTDALLLGLTYRAEYETELKGNLRLRNLDPSLPLPGSSKLEIDWDNPQWLEAGLAWRLAPNRYLWFRGNWQDWSTFSENQLAVSLPGPGQAPQALALDRRFEDTWSAGIGFGTRQRELTPDAARPSGGWLFGLNYESSPVKDRDRTVDLPFDESWRISAGYFRQRKDQYDWSVSAQLQIFGDAELDQTAQGARFSGDFQDFYAIFLTGTLRFLD